ncbi:hypothetical protein QUF74_13145 [Candidatus Halobeggiatoa sp. HSG11]|nr:hypothetical protein [Candidatus Halobeggiatoa sp. HSG11]
MTNKLDDLDCLREFGTPKAALALVPFLWHKDYDLASHATLNLAILLSKLEVENALRGYELTKEQQKDEWFKWVWEPFNEYEPNNSSLPVIAGRIGYLIDQLPEEYLKNCNKVSNLDSRIIIPLVIHNQTKWKKILESVVKEHPKKEFVKFKSTLEDKNTPKPTLNDWKNIFLPSEYKFKESLHLKSILLIFSLLIIIYIIELLNYFESYSLLTPSSIPPLLPLLTLFLLAVLLLILFIICVLAYFLIFFEFIKKLHSKKEQITLILVMSSFLYGIILPLFKSLLLYSSLFTIQIYLATTLTIVLLFITGKRKEREAQNPLHGLLEPPKQ